MIWQCIYVDIMWTIAAFRERVLRAEQFTCGPEVQLLHRRNVPPYHFHQPDH